jgi:hypothetical protein
MKVDVVIDRFVERLTREGWHFNAIISAWWIDSFEERLPVRLPRSFSSLVKRYRFASFHFRNVSFFSNLGTGDDEDLVNAVFRDKHLAAALQADSFRLVDPKLAHMTWCASIPVSSEQQSALWWCLIMKSCCSTTGCE